MSTFSYVDGSGAVVGSLGTGEATARVLKIATRVGRVNCILKVGYVLR